jgi:hypothetical protein
MEVAVAARSGDRGVLGVVEGGVAAVPEAGGQVGEPAADELAVVPAGGSVELVAAAVLGGEESCRAFQQVTNVCDLGPV